jgi:hypothetical protein
MSIEENLQNAVLKAAGTTKGAMQLSYHRGHQ